MASKHSGVFAHQTGGGIFVKRGGYRAEKQGFLRFGVR